MTTSGVTTASLSDLRVYDGPFDAYYGEDPDAYCPLCRCIKSRDVDIANARLAEVCDDNQCRCHVECTVCGAPGAEPGDEAICEACFAARCSHETGTVA